MSTGRFIIHYGPIPGSKPLFYSGTAGRPVGTKKAATRFPSRAAASQRLDGLRTIFANTPSWDQRLVEGAFVEELPDNKGQIGRGRKTEEYAVHFMLKVWGEVVAGPKAGRTLDGAYWTTPMCNDADAAIEKAAGYITDGTFTGRVEVIARVFDGESGLFDHTAVATVEGTAGEKPKVTRYDGR